MSDTTFVPGVTNIAATWLQGVNDYVYTPQSVVRADLGLYGIVGDGLTDDTVAIQACIDANQTATIDFGGPDKTYLCSDSIKLVDSTHDFQGSLIGTGCTFTFSNSGTSTDADKDMESGFRVWPTAAANGNDVSGWKNGALQGLIINCPANGAGLYMANSQRVSVIHCSFIGGRYGIALECCILTTISRNTFTNNKNAGLGMIMSSNTNICYNNAANPETSFWNDIPLIIANGFQSGVTGGLAHILDHGSQSESMRTVVNNYFYSDANADVQYGYLGRNCNPQISNNFFENINYPVRLLNSNASEGGGNMTGVTAAQPSGTYAMASIPDGYCYTCTITGNYTARAVNDFELSGLTDAGFIGQNISQLSTGFFLKSTQAGGQRLVDGGNTFLLASGSYKSIYSAANYTSSILGTYTSGDAYPGDIGQYTESVIEPASAVSLVTDTNKNITSISLTAGDWDVQGNVGFIPDTTTNIAALKGAVSNVSATFGSDAWAWQTSPAPVPSTINQLSTTPMVRYSLASTTTIYLVAKANFTVSTMTGYGSIRARRVR